MYFKKEKKTKEDKLCVYYNLQKYIQYHERKHLQGLLKFIDQFGEDALSSYDKNYLEEYYFGYFSSKKILPIKTPKQKDMKESYDEDLLIYTPVLCE